MYAILALILASNVYSSEDSYGMPREINYLSKEKLKGMSVEDLKTELKKIYKRGVLRGKYYSSTEKNWIPLTGHQWTLCKDEALRISRRLYYKSEGELVIDYFDGEPVNEIYREKYVQEFLKNN